MTLYHVSPLSREDGTPMTTVSRLIEAEPIDLPREVRIQLGWGEFHAEPVPEGESYSPRMYKLVGWNDMRQLQFTIYVQARSAGEAERTADRERERRGLLRANTWRTTPAV